jgi:hypothetical protein
VQPAGAKAGGGKDAPWSLDFRFKTPRAYTIEIDGLGKRSYWYLWYEVRNPTGKPRTFVPEFELVPPDGSEGYIHDQVLPAVQEKIRRFEDPTGRFDLKNSATIAREPIPPSKPDEPAVTGVAIWEGVSPDVAGLTVAVTGLSNSWAVDEGGKVQREVLQLRFRREGAAMRLVPPAARLNPVNVRVIPGERRVPAEGVKVSPARPPQQSPREKGAPEETNGAGKEVAVQVRLEGPLGARIRTVPPRGGASPKSDPVSLTLPVRLSLPAGRFYRLKLSHIPNCPGLDLYPTLEVAPATPQTTTFLEHNCVPIGLTMEEIELVRDGNFLTKVICLPDSGDSKPIEISSAHGKVTDPIAEARRQGQILAVVRVGDIDLENREKRQAP